MQTGTVREFVRGFTTLMLDIRDPNRNAYICLIYYGDGEKRYILHPRGAIIRDTIVFGTEVPIKPISVLI